MQGRFDPIAAALIGVMVLLPFACSSSGGDGGSGSGGSRTASGPGSGGSRTASGGATAGPGEVSSGSGGTMSGTGGQLGSGGIVTGTSGMVSGSGGALGSGAQTKSGGGGGRVGGTGGTSTDGAGRTNSGGSPPGSGGAAATGVTGGGTTGAARGGATGVTGGGATGVTGGGTTGATGGGTAGAAGCDEAHGYHLSAKGDTCTNAPRMLCVFDYDLVLSSHSCQQTMSMPTEYLCRTNACTTYTWHDQCLATGARAALAECVRHGAYIGIASHAYFDECWNDKVIQTLTPAAFPELFSSIHYDKPGTDFSYPAIDNKTNWNCNTCAYHFDGTITAGKSPLIRKVMAHYGLSPTSAADQSRVVYWDDDPSYLQEVRTNLPNVATIAVASTNPSSNGAGCGIQAANISAGWAALTANSP